MQDAPEAQKGAGAQMARIITTAIIKGGTGKTTTAAALAQAARKKGYKVLVVDLDPQGNLSSFFDAGADAGSSYDFLHGAAPEEVLQETAQDIDIIAASADLATEKTTGGSAKRLERALEPIKGSYDFIFIDTPPQMGELTFNALQASTGLLIPLEADNSSIQGLYQISEIAETMRARSAKNLSLLGVFVTRYNGRAKINAFMRDAIEEAAAEIGAPYLGEIRAGVSIKEAQGMRKSLFEYAPRSNPAQDYMKIFKRIERGN